MKITGFLGIYSNPRHVVACIDGEIRQQYESTYIGCLVGGEPAINNEAGGIRVIRAADLSEYGIHPACASRSVTFALVPTLITADPPAARDYQMPPILGDSAAVRLTCRALAELRLD